MYLHHTNGLKLQFCKIRSSRSPMKIMEYDGAIFVPMAVRLTSPYILRFEKYKCEVCDVYYFA